MNFNLELPSLLFLDPFSTWLYTNKAGANGVLYSYMNGVPISTINSTCVPQAVTAIAQAIAVSIRILMINEIGLSTVPDLDRQSDQLLIDEKRV